MLAPPKAAPTSAPSGIAQLRQSIDASANAPQSDAMNLDDFIFSTSIATPLESSPSPAPQDHSAASGSAVATAIPIKGKKNPYDQPPVFPLSSAPVPPRHPSRGREFDYVQRHVRKTSIDERKVFDPSPERLLLPSGLTSQRPGNGQPNSRLKFLRSTAL